MSTIDDVVVRLDLLLATIRLAHAPAIADGKARIVGDPVNAAILDATEDWRAAGELTSEISRQCSVSVRTVRSRVADLLSGRVLEVIGAGPTTKYRRSGLL